MIGSTGPLHIAAPYLEVMRQLNGAKLHAIDLYGWLEDESNQRRCLSSYAANRFWINGYLGLPKASFHFGSRIFSREENMGYFYHPSSNKVFSARKFGGVVKEWPSIYDMLRDEWEISKKLEVQMRGRLNSK